VIPADVAVVSEPHSAAGRRWDRRGLSPEMGRLRGEFRRFSATTLTVAMMATGVLVACRRTVGSMTAGLTWGGMAVTVLIMLAFVLACDWLARPIGRDTGAADSRTGQRLLARVGMLLTVWGISGGTTPLAAVIAGTGSLAAVMSLVPLGLVARLRAGLQRSTVQKDSHRAADRPETGFPHTGSVRPISSTHPCDTPNVVQQQVRRRTAAGEESIRGTVVVSFHAGDRLAVAHVGFCPPLQETPAVHLSTAYDELDAVVTAGEILPWGIRVECRLEEAAEDPFDIPVDYRATSPRREC
jgi:hypothetical protein